MKFLKFDLLAYGMFTDYTIDFIDGNKLNIIYGPNEAGKSTALRAIRSLLFGIDHRTTDSYKHSSNMRIGGCLRHSDGTILNFQRRKGRKDTFLDREGVPVDESLLQKFLPGLNKELFLRRFGIDHDALVLGADEILKGGGELGQSLFAADFGGISLHKIIEKLNKDAKELFIPKGHTQRIILKKKEFDEINKKIKELSRQSSEYPEIIKDLDIAQREKKLLSEEINELSKKKEHLNRIKSAIPMIAKLEERQKQQKELGKVEHLPDDFTERRRKSQKELEIADRDIKTANKNIQRIDEELSGISVPQEFLEQRKMVTHLHQELGNYIDGQKNLDKLKREKLEHEISAKSILKDLPISNTITIEKVINMRPNRALRNRIQTLANEFGKREESLKHTQDDIEINNVDLKHIDEQLQKLAEFNDTASVEDEVERVQQRGDIEIQLKRLKGNTSSKKANIETEIQRISCWSGNIEELNVLQLPLPETIDEFTNKYSDLKHKERTVEQNISDNEAALIQIEDEIKTMIKSGAIHSEDELHQLRKHRDKGWTLIKRTWLDGEDISEEKTKYCKDEELSTAYEKSVYITDETADIMRNNADRIAQFGEKNQRLAEITIRKIELKEQKQKIDTDKAELSKKWKEIWKEAAVEPLSPSEMKSWLQRVMLILKEIQDLNENRQNINETQEELDISKNELKAVLTEFNEISGYENKSLSILKRQCTKVINEYKKTNQRIQNLREQQESFAKKGKQLKKLFQKASDNMTQWENNWSEAVGSLDIPGRFSPDDVLIVISGIEDINSELDLVNEIEIRIEEIKRFAEEYKAKVTDFAKEYSSELVGLPLELAVERIHTQLSDAGEIAVTHQQLEKQLYDNKTNYDNAIIKKQESEIKLTTLCQIAQCDNPSELEAIEYRFSRYKSLADFIDTQKQNLVVLTAGKELDEFIREVEDEDPDMLPGRLSDIEERFNEQENKRQEMDQSIGNMRQRLSQIDGSAEAAEAAEQKQELIAAMRDESEKYIRLHLASKLIKRELERYREENQGPLVKRAGVLFGILTQQSFSSLQTDFNEKDEPVLKGIKNGNLVSVEAMSDGTRDQLYLSLRIASLEKYLEVNEPIPFIVDDILIKFDEERARATFQVLLELSHKTQLIFFTHNIHLLNVASNVFGKNNLNIHKLGT